jgi:GLPGLI family protein
MHNRRGFGFIVLIACFVQIVSVANAQQLVLSGKITYERKENMHKQLTDQSSWTEEVKKRMPKFRIDQFQLAFNSHEGLYKVIQEDESTFASWWRVAHKNTVKTNLDNKTYLANKNVYERDYRVIDSLPAFQWKLISEYRNIAGYNCRKASTIIMDSIYIIAFYTDEIPVSTGPESFNGLPGMIMGIVIPRMNLTYFATKVENQFPPESEFVLPEQKKLKQINFVSMKDEIMKALKDWGEDASKIYWKVML